MNAIKYFKLDFSLVKVGYAFFSLFIAFLAGMYILLKSPGFALICISYLIVFVSPLPFTHEAGTKCQGMYYMFPAKIKDMVLGRYFYLLSNIILVLIIYFFAIHNRTIDSFIIVNICISGVAACILVFIQYPVLYKIGFARGNMASVLVFASPLFIIPILTMIFFSVKKDIVFSDTYQFVRDNLNTIGVVSIVFIGLLAIISYKVSFNICRKKEI